jgi:hypothetical protein
MAQVLEMVEKGLFVRIKSIIRAGTGTRGVFPHLKQFCESSLEHGGGRKTNGREV